MANLCFFSMSIKDSAFLVPISCGSAGKEPACNVGDVGSIPELGISPGEGKGYPLQYSGLENFMDCIVHGVAQSWTQPSDFYRVLVVVDALLVVSCGI